MLLCYCYCNILIAVVITSQPISTNNLVLVTVATAFTVVRHHNSRSIFLGDHNETNEDNELLQAESAQEE